MSMLDVLDHFLAEAVACGASDLHLTSEQLPMIRVDGGLLTMGGAALGADDVSRMLQALCADYQWDEYRQQRTVDIGYTAPGNKRFRINAYQELGRPAIAARYLDQRMLSLSELGLPPVIGSLADLKSGLVLVTGATGSGKSTTLAALINEINTQRACHIITIEDPVEFIHERKKSLIHYRELHADVPGFAQAVRASLREDPDVILVGEMRDLETVDAALTAAETGHLVFSTLHTGEAIGSIERLVASFPGEEQALARHRVGMVLKAVVSQRLVPSERNQGRRLPAVEVLIVNPAVANLIENSKTRQIASAMETGSSQGMQTLDQSLARWVAMGKLNMRQALPYCCDPQALERLVAGAARGAA